MLTFVMCAVFAILPACSQNETEKWAFSGEAVGAEMEYSTSAYTDMYNSEIFYKNELRTAGADPHAIYVSYADVVDSYKKLRENFMYIGDGGALCWQNGWDVSRFESKYGTEEEWIEAYADNYYMTNTDGSGGLTADDAEKYGCTNCYFPIYEAADLNNWKKVGKVSGCAIASDFNNEWHYSHFWAPELYRDGASGLFFIFYSAVTKNGNKNTTFTPNNTGNDAFSISCAVSFTPDGPYYPVTSETYYEYIALKDADGKVVCGDTPVPGPDLNRDGESDYSYYEIYSRDGTSVIGYKNEEKFYTPAGYEITKMTPAINVGYYYPRLATDSDKIAEFEAVAHLRNYSGYADTDIDVCLFYPIDIHMFFDPVSQKRYVYFSATNMSFAGRASFDSSIWGMEMTDMITPNWDTLTRLTCSGRSTVYHDQTFFGADGPKGNDEGSVNEGPEVLYHNGKYYLTYSPIGYTSRLYSVQVAVSDSPLGEFVKLPYEHSPLIGIGIEFSDYMSGMGHHCFIQAGDELFALYHAFANAENNNYPNGFLGRMIAMDRIFFKYDEELGYDAIYANGATVSAQPKPESFTGLMNVARLAGISGNGDIGDVSYLTDGMFTAQPYSRKFEYGKSDGKLMITLTWDKPVTVKALQIYNSGSYYDAFKNVELVQFRLASKPAWYASDEYNGYVYLKDIPVDPADYNQKECIVRKGASAIAEFNEIAIDEMYVCIACGKENKFSTDYSDFSQQGVNSAVKVPEIYVYGKEATL